jgi:hypothetical protein
MVLIGYLQSLSSLYRVAEKIDASRAPVIEVLRDTFALAAGR